MNKVTGHPPKQSISEVIESAKQSYESWPQWMKDAAVWEMASFPKSSWYKPEKNKELSK